MISCVSVSIRDLPSVKIGWISDLAITSLIAVSAAAFTDELFKLVLQGEEKKVLNFYRQIYDQGVEPKIFINDFIELIYYFKNIDSLSIESTNFSLNDEEFKKIKELSSSMDNQILILFWQYSIKTLEELEIVSNQNLSIEMFLIRLMYLNSMKSGNNLIDEKSNKQTFESRERISDFKKDGIDQIKNITQEKKDKHEIKTDKKSNNKILINTFKN